jgi:hypothetical protein
MPKAVCYSLINRTNDLCFRKGEKATQRSEFEFKSLSRSTMKYIWTGLRLWKFFLEKSRYDWVVMSFSTYYQSTVFEPRDHPDKSLPAFSSRITRTMPTDYVWHTPALQNCLRTAPYTERRDILLLEKNLYPACFTIYLLLASIISAYGLDDMRR